MGKYALTEILHMNCILLAYPYRLLCNKATQPTCFQLTYCDISGYWKLCCKDHHG